MPERKVFGIMEEHKDAGTIKRTSKEISGILEQMDEQAKDHHYQCSFRSGSFDCYFGVFLRRHRNPLF